MSGLKGVSSHGEIKINYSEKALIECCSRIAEDLRLPNPHPQEVVEKLTEVLVKREAYVSMENNLITKNELANLVFQHLDNLVVKGKGTISTRTYTMEREIHAKIKRALLGKPG